MEMHVFGRTDLEVSRLTFGCGAVGGLMTKGKATDQDRAVAWARDNGINFFDTAPSYGEGASETNLGRALGGNTDGIVVSSKVGLPQTEITNAAGYIEQSLHASLTRLRLGHIDLLQLHNTIGEPDRHGAITAEQVLTDVTWVLPQKVIPDNCCNWFNLTNLIVHKYFIICWCPVPVRQLLQTIHPRTTESF